MTNLVFKEKIKEFEEQVHKEGYSNISFLRYETGSGFGIMCIHKDYEEPIFYSGTIYSFETKYQSVLFQFEAYIRNNPKYM